eukprot:362110-Chlamydomonas_euryale.AAC.5
MRRLWDARAALLRPFAFAPHRHTFARPPPVTQTQCGSINSHAGGVESSSAAQRQMRFTPGSGSDARPGTRMTRAHWARAAQSERGH